VDELAALINSGDEANCKLAAACAATVNEGNALESDGLSAAPAGPSLEISTVATLPGTALAATGDVGVQRQVAQKKPPAGPLPPGWLVMAVPQPEDVELPAPESPEDFVVGIERHMAVVSNPSAPEKALTVSTNALLTVLSGGYDPGLRLEVIKVLLGRIDVAYYALLVGHLEEIRAEAEDFGNESLAREATSALRQIESALE
jgi:hypothetical protein